MEMSKNFSNILSWNRKRSHYSVINEERIRFIEYELLRKWVEKMVKIVYGTEPYRIDHEVRKLTENTAYYVQIFDAMDGVKEFLQSISFFGVPCAIYKVEDVKKERKELVSYGRVSGKFLFDHSDGKA